MSSLGEIRQLVREIESTVRSARYDATEYAGIVGKPEYRDDVSGIIREMEGVLAEEASLIEGAKLKIQELIDVFNGAATEALQIADSAIQQIEDLKTEAKRQMEEDAQSLLDRIGEPKGLEGLLAQLARA